MAIVHNLAGTIREKVITEVMIPEIRKALVARNVVTVKEDLLATKSIKIWGVGDVTTSAWDGGVITYSDHTNSAIDLLMNKGSQFGQTTNNVDTTGAAEDVLSSVIGSGTYKMGIDIDTAVFAEMLTTTKTGTDIAVVDETNVAGLFTEAQVLADNAGFPDAGRDMTVTPEVASALGEVVAGLGNDALSGEAQRTGYVGFYKGFSIYKSTNLPAGTNSIASMPSATVLGLGYSTVDASDVPNQPQVKSYGAIQFGVELVKEEFVIKFLTE